MASLRKSNWRLFGVCGTIVAYVCGILLLSIISLNNPHQRRMRSAHYSDSYEVFKHRELGILSRRPPLQWCQELRYLTDPEIPQYSKSTTTQKPYSSFSGHFLKKYEKFLRKNTTSSVTNPNLSNRRGNGDSNNALVNQRNSHYEHRSASASKVDGGIKFNNVNSKDIYYERLWPKTNNLRKKSVKVTEAPETGLTALASFPGSGNTWLRYLLQQATGIYTGSVYKDFGLLKSGFPAEYVCNSSVLVVKTHEWGPNAWLQFSRAILLVRDPDRSILAEFNRQSGGHVGFASPERYRRTKGRYWQQFVANKLWAWEQMNLQWAKNFTGDVHIVYYDDLVDNVDGTLRDILHFLNFPIDKDLFRCAMSRKEGIYRRKKRIMAFDPYTPAMHAALEAKKHEVYAALGRYKY